MQPSLAKLALIPICWVWMCLGNQCGWEAQYSRRWRSVTIISLMWPLREDFFPGINLQNTFFHDSSMDFSQVQHNEVSFLPKSQSSVSIELCYLSSNILIRRTRYSPRSQEIMSGLEQKLGCSIPSYSKWEPECVPKRTWLDLESCLGEMILAAKRPAASYCWNPVSPWRTWAATSDTISLVLCFMITSQWWPVLFAIPWHPVFNVQRVHWKVETWIYIM